MAEKKGDIRLTCEYLSAPLGIQNESPRFGWKVYGTYKKKEQIAYRICVYTSHGHCIWDSGKVLSKQCSAIEYEGEALKSFSEYGWKLELWLENSESTGEQLYAEDIFETGILKQAEWRGNWIHAKGVTKGSVPLFRREFTLNKPIAKGRLYISGIGYCEAWINGEKLGDAFLDPGWTNYKKTVLYRTYDVTEFLREGVNVLAVELGGGWLSLEHPGFLKMIGKQPPWLSEPKLLCNLYLDDQCIATNEDDTWMWAEGPIRHHNIYDGEYYDSSFEKNGYRLPIFQPVQEEWRTAEEIEEPGGVLRSQIMPPIRKVEQRIPVYMEYIGEEEDYTMTVDFGVNFSGWVSIRATGKPGQKIRLLYGEILDQKRAVDQRNLRKAKAEDIFVFSEAECITYEPHFVYHGFRYVQVIMTPGVVVEEIIGCEIHTDVKKIGDFSCSNVLLNDIHKAVQNTEINNLHSVPTDCPQRDERLGWMNDMTVRFEEGLYNYDMILFYEKWLQDIADEQREDGAIPDTVPYFFGDLPASHISSVYVMLPWNLYLFYGDKQILQNHYKGITEYVENKLNQRDKEGMLPEQWFGDWAPPMTEAFLGWGENAVPKNITQKFITTCYLYYDCMILKKIGAVLRQNRDIRRYEKMAEEIKNDLNRCFLNSDGNYDKGSQGCNLFPLFLGIVPPAEKTRVLANLKEDIVEKNQYHTSTGNQMTKYLYEVLNQENMNDIAYKIASNESYPSLGFMIRNGATSIWERWEKLTSGHMNSHSHPMLGAFTVWFYKGLAGLEIDDEHFGNLILRPAILDGLEYAEASHEFPWGKCSTRWEKKEKEIRFSFEIPWSMSAVLDLSHCDVVYDKIIYEDCQVSLNEIETKIFNCGSYNVRFLMP